MNSRKLLVAFSWVGNMELTVTLLPVWIGLAIAFQHKSNVFVFAAALQMLCSKILLILSRQWSKALGLKYYYAVPIAPLILRLLLFRRLPLSPGRPCYLLHVDTKNSHGSPREALTAMRSDILALQKEWCSKSVFVGNTFAHLGTIQGQIIRALADVQVTEGVLTPFQKIFFSEQQLRSHQMKVFGRTLPASPIRWRIIMIQTRNGSV